MEFLLLLAIGFLVRGALEHSKGDRGRSRDQKVKEVAKSFPKGTLNKSQQKAAARRHAAGWWAREVRHGFPVHRTGWHAAWLAHQTVADHHKARREEARTTALETRASVLKGMPEHKQRQAEAQKELDAIEAELAAQQAKGSPVTGKSAVQSAADEVSRKRKEREQATGPRCPSCGAPEGYDHRPGCDPAVPPLPADGVTLLTARSKSGRPVNAVTGAPEDTVAVYGGEDLDRRLAAAAEDPDIEVTTRPAPQPEPPLPSPDLGRQHVCAACGHPGTQEDDLVRREGWRVHQSHTTDPASGFYEEPSPGRGSAAAQADAARDYASARDAGDHDAAESALNRYHDARRQNGGREVPIPPPAGYDPGPGACDCGMPACRSGWPEDAPDIYPPSPTTQGAPVTDTNYTAVLTNAKKAADDAEQDAVAASQRRQIAQQHAEEMQAAEVDGATLSSQMELVERLQAAEQAAKETGEHAMAVFTGLQQRHGGLKQAHDDAPVRAAQRGFYEGD